MPGLSLPDRVRLRIRTAEQYNDAADILGQKLTDTGPAQPILRILAFEVLLKTAALVAKPTERKKDHDYLTIWNSLSDNTRDDLLASAIEQAPLDCPDFDDLPKFLTSWQRVFLQGRYEYETNEARSNEEIRSITDNWDGSPETADFAYYPQELEGLTRALLRHLSTYLEQSAS